MANIEMPSLPRPATANRAAVDPATTLIELAAHLDRAALAEPGKPWGDVRAAAPEPQETVAAAYITAVDSPMRGGGAQSPARQHRHLVVPASPTSSHSPFQTVRGSPSQYASPAARRYFGTAHDNPLASETQGGDAEQAPSASLRPPSFGLMPQASHSPSSRPISGRGWPGLKGCLGGGYTQGEDPQLLHAPRPLGEATEGGIDGYTDSGQVWRVGEARNLQFRQHFSLTTPHLSTRAPQALTSAEQSYVSAFLDRAGGAPRDSAAIPPSPLGSPPPALYPGLPERGASTGGGSRPGSASATRPGPSLSSFPARLVGGVAKVFRAGSSITGSQGRCVIKMGMVAGGGG